MHWLLRGVVPSFVLVAALVAPQACDDQAQEPVSDEPRARDAGTDTGDDTGEGKPSRDGGGSGSTREAGPPASGERVRIVAANVTSGNRSSYEAPGMRILQGLKPDIVLLQEAKVQSGTLRAFVDTTLGTSFALYVDPRTTGIPNAVVSRYPITKSGVWVDSQVADRGYTYARLDVPGDVDLWAVSLHLLTSSSSERAAEARELIALVKAEIPASDYLVVGGDLNTSGDREAAMLELAKVVVVEEPFPADSAGTSTNRPRSKHYDWVLASANLDTRHTPVVIGARSFASGLVFDSRRYTPLADVAPVLQLDSDAENMQHMAVVRDFLVE